ncbi:sugar kinase [Candidatus Magnetoovum chiemensis]|nr:sugar kinase [Candidatus Magnetoovum chiemensis]
MKVATSAEMREIDKITIDVIGIPSAVLMERAGLSVVKHILKLHENRPIIVLSGGGNNGGDGLVIARELYNHNLSVKAVILSELDRLSPDCKAQYDIAQKIGVDVQITAEVEEEDLKDAVIVDALLGTGLVSDVKENIAKIIRLVNSKPREVVAVDIASGISSDTGQIMGNAIRATNTVTFGVPKRGHLIYPGKEYTGNLFIENIGFPQNLLNNDSIKCELLEKALMTILIPPKEYDSHKGDNGHVLVVGGARGKTGALTMAAKAALKSGCGLVTLGVPASLADIYQSKVLEEMVLPLKDNTSGYFKKDAASQILDFINKDNFVLALGPGMAVDGDGEYLIRELILNSDAPIIIDADGLNNLSKFGKKEMVNVLSSSKSSVVLTPHVGEMARLIASGDSDFKSKCSEINRNKIEIAAEFTKETSGYLVLKGVPTVISDPEGAVFINPTGSPSMATAGSGDVLTGMIASFSAQGLPPLYASLLGVYMHGLSGEISAERNGIHSTTASDLIANISEVFKFLLYSEK